MKKLSSVLIILGGVTFFASLTIFILTFYPVISTEVSYQLNKTQNKPLELKPVDTNFGVVIPKITANAKVIENVSPFNQQEYQWALTKGIAHGLGSSFPGQVGNVFLFSHSSVNFYEAQRYNSIFYLLDKLEKGDVIYLYFKNEKFQYQVSEKKLVWANEVNYLKGQGFTKTVTLMTCWPPGTTFKRLLVLAEIVNK
ncbi:sortase [Candidatus Daviesbacteria bacterium]|nr:sortase [Candidatus Daviesbacteria bacterium]